MPAPRRVALLLVLCVLVVPIAAASPQPRVVCSVCGGRFADAAGDVGVELTVEHSTATVSIDSDGDAAWRVRNRIPNDSALARLRSNPGLLDRIAADAFDARGGAADPPLRNVTASVTDPGITVRFEDPDAARRIGGVLVVDYLHTDGHGYWYLVNADRFTVVGPEGTVVPNDPPGATVSGRRATWTGSSDYGEPLHEDAYVTFAPESPAPGVLASVAIAVATVPLVGHLFVTVALPALLALVGALAVVHAGGRRWLDRTRDPGRLGVAVAGVGVATLAHPLYAPVVPVVSGTNYWLIGIGGPFVAAGVTALAPIPNHRRIPVRAVLVPAITIAILWPILFALLDSPPITGAERVWRGLGIALRALPIAAMFAFGHLANDGRGRWRFPVGAGTVAGALLVFLFAVGALTERPAWGLTIVFYVAYAVAIGIAGAPLYALGGVLASDDDGPGTDAEPHREGPATG